MIAATSRPAILPVTPSGLPDDFTHHRRFVVWAIEQRDGKPTKPLLRADGRGYAKTNDATTWATLEAALEAYTTRTLAGIGIVLNRALGIVFVDLDKCIDPATGELAPWAVRIIAALEAAGAYIEYSPSGTGLHAFVYGELPEGIGHKRAMPNGGAFEWYTELRYATLTGHQWSAPPVKHIGNGQAVIDDLSAKLFPPKPERPNIPDNVRDIPPLTVADDDLLEQCRRSPLFVRLEAGDDGDYQGDTSRADLAYANLIVRNGGTPAQVDALYRRSGRARPKWDERRGDRTYGERTIAEAFDGTVTPLAVIPAPNSQKTNLVDPAPNSASAGCAHPDCQARIAHLEWRVAQLEKALEAERTKSERAAQHAGQITHLDRLKAKVLANRDLKAESRAVLALAALAPTLQRNDRGQARLYLDDLAHQSGLADAKTASKRIKFMAEQGWLKHDVQFNPETGKLATWIDVDVEDVLTKAATYKPFGGEGKPRQKHACPDHPNSNLRHIRTDVWACEDCGQVTHTSEHVEIETWDDGPNAEKPTLVPEAAPAAHCPAPPPVEVVRRSVNPAICHNDDMPVDRTARSHYGNSGGAAWVSGSSPPLFDMPAGDLATWRH
jgi:hypothetical protein